MADAELIEQLRRALPQLLREHPEVRHELWGLMLEAFPSRQEFLAFLEELRALREERTGDLTDYNTRLPSGLRQWITALKRCCAR